MIRQKVMLTIMSVCLVNINISAAELLPEESTSSVEISFEEEIEETESDLKLEDSVTTEVVLDQYYEESAVETESYEELVNQEIMDSVPPETESMVNNLKSVEEIIGKTDQIKQISKENEQLTYTLVLLPIKLLLPMFLYVQLLLPLYMYPYRMPLLLLSQSLILNALLKYFHLHNIL